MKRAGVASAVVCHIAKHLVCYNHAVRLASSQLGFAGLGALLVLNSACQCFHPVDECRPSQCSAIGANCGIVTDRCGGQVDCGHCAGPSVCGGDGTPNVCSCVRQTCASRGATCGAISDECGHQLDCGSCVSPEACGGGGTPNVCGCVPKTCATLGADCGALSNGCGRQLDCGSCSPPEVCGRAGVPNVCGCAAETCATLGATCGTVADGCGSQLGCGSCAPPETCGGAGIANNCGCTRLTCVDQTLECGAASDGCGGALVCGTCAGNAVCSTGRCAVCNGTVCSNTCVDPLTDLRHCGFCGRTCLPPPPNATAQCDAGNCAWTCVVGSSDCDGDAGNGCESQPQTDSRNCGACGHDCLGGGCVAGRCQPVVLVSGLIPQFTYKVAVDEQALYWVQSFMPRATEVRMLRLDGGASTVLASVPIGLTQGYPSALVATRQRVYAAISTDPGFVLGVDVDGGDLLTLMAGERPRGLAIDGTSAYWGSSFVPAADRSIQRAPLDGGPASVLTTDPAGINDLVTDGVNVYWLSTTVNKVSVDGGAAVVLAVAQPPVQLAIGGGYLYWTTYSPPGANAGTIMRVALDGGAPSVLVSGQDSPIGIDVDVSGVYWTNYGTGTVMTLPLDGGGRRQLAAASGPWGITLDAKSVYFTDVLSGTISRVAK